MRPVRAAVAALVVLFTALPVAAMHPPPEPSPRLSTLVAAQKRVVPGATVVSGFHDWREVSKYRSHAGEHLGYDIAMPAGSPAVAGWAGRVTRIVPWVKDEWGITVASPDGYETTYGHLRATVAVGDEVAAGDAVGTVVHDHVDVKMRGPDGLYYDFGAPAVAGQGRPGQGTAVAREKGPGQRTSLARLDKAELLRRYLRARYSVDISHDDAERILAAEKAAQEAYDRHRDTIDDVSRRMGLPKTTPATVVDRLRELADQWQRRKRDTTTAWSQVARARHELTALRAELHRRGIAEPR